MSMDTEEGQPPKISNRTGHTRQQGSHSFKDRAVTRAYLRDKPNERHHGEAAVLDLLDLKLAMSPLDQPKGSKMPPG